MPKKSTATTAAQTAKTARAAIVLPPGKDRSYPMGRISAVFKADEAETQHQYSISEWWLEPNCTGPGAHAHPEDDVFFVIEGTMSFLIGEAWQDAPKAASFWFPVAPPTILKTAAPNVRVCSTSRFLVVLNPT